MKNLVKGFSSSLLVVCLATSYLGAQEIEIPRASPKASISQTIGVCSVSVNYGRPSVRNRKVFGNLVPFGKVWRAGANEASVITFNYPIRIGGNAVPSGSYGLFMIPQKDKWTIILNKDWNQWGAYNYNEKDDVVRIEVVPETSGHTELCTYTFVKVDKTKGSLQLTWENTRVAFEIETDTPSQTLTEIERVTKKTKEDWFNFSAAAQYHFYELKEAKQALRYINIAIALEAPNPAPWMLKSQILASQNNYKEAIKYAREALNVANRYNFHYEIEENEEQISKWEKMIKP